VSRRTYRQTRRAEAAEETRRRIVQATFNLHAEQGIAATSMKQIADRAGVGVGSVYNHMGTYEEAVRACGEFTAREFPMPDASCFDDAADPGMRIGLLAAALFEYYEKLPVLERLRVEPTPLPTVRDFLDEEDRKRADLVRKALRLRRTADRRVRLVSALLDVGTYRSLRRAGYDTAQCAEEISNVIGFRL
jgi:AcrR family transcriptional regulator